MTVDVRRLKEIIEEEIDRIHLMEQPQAQMPPQQKAEMLAQVLNSMGMTLGAAQEALGVLDMTVGAESPDPGGERTMGILQGLLGAEQAAIEAAEAQGMQDKHTQRKETEGGLGMTEAKVLVLQADLERVLSESDSIDQLLYEQEEREKGLIYQLKIKMTINPGVYISDVATQIRAIQDVTIVSTSSAVKGVGSVVQPALMRVKFLKGNQPLKHYVQTIMSSLENPKLVKGVSNVTLLGMTRVER